MRKLFLSAPLVLCAALALGSLSASAQTVLYVNVDASGAANGSSWTDAYTSLETAIQAAVSGDEIWVAAGVYYPTNDYGLGAGSRGKHFRLKNGVQVFGGFKGTETNRNKRDPALNVTILSGDIGASGVTSDNCYHVFYHPATMELDHSAVLDGVTISDGNAGDDASPHDRGAGMYNSSASPDLVDCIFADNSAAANGGGMYNDSSSPVLTDCEFSGNAADGDGGGIYNTDSSSPNLTDCVFSDNAASGNGAGICNNNSSPTLTGCEFADNTATGNGGGIYNNSASPATRECSFAGNGAQYGGAIYNFDHSSPNARNCTFSGNSADVSGGGIYNLSNSAPILTNCAFHGNSATVYGGALYTDATAPGLSNCILWGDTAPTGPEVHNANGADPEFTCCDVAGSGGSAAWQAAFGSDGGGNIDADPSFLDAANGNLHLQGGSPCIDAADGDVAPTLDKDGHHRFDDPGTANTGTGTPNYADIGAYEYQLVAVTFPSASGISLEAGQKTQITWITSLPSNTPMRIELIKGGAETWELSTAASKGRFNWTVGKWKSKTQEVYPDGDDYKVRMSTLDDSYSDESDNDFAIGSVTSLTIAGPADVTGGAAPVQYTCTAHYNFGPDRDVTGEVKWSITKIKGVKLKIAKGGLLTTPVVAFDIPCTITATYGKGKSLKSDVYDIIVHTP